jgi:hypothetical protein
VVAKIEEMVAALTGGWELDWSALRACSGVWGAPEPAEKKSAWPEQAVTNGRKRGGKEEGDSGLLASKLAMRGAG